MGVKEHVCTAEKPKLCLYLFMNLRLIVTPNNVLRDPIVFVFYRLYYSGWNSPFSSIHFVSEQHSRSTCKSHSFVVKQPESPEYKTNNNNNNLGILDSDTVRLMNAGG